MLDEGSAVIRGYFMLIPQQSDLRSLLPHYLITSTELVSSSGKLSCTQYPSSSRLRGRIESGVCFWNEKSTMKSFFVAASTSWASRK